MSEQNEKDIGALWMKRSKNGGDYMTGMVNGQKVVIFPNRYKKQDKHPDYRVYPSKERDQEQPRPRGSVAPTVDDGDVPF